MTVRGHPEGPETIALWLFDEPAYPAATLTDAGPRLIDLRLGASGELVPGRFGNALRLTTNPGHAAIMPCPDDALFALPYPARLARSPAPEDLNLGYFDFTVELWFLGEGEQPDEGRLLDIQARETDLVPPFGNSLSIAPGRTHWILRCGATGLDLRVPTDSATISDGDWHHLAFALDARQQQLTHWVDGQPQVLPDRGDLVPPVGLVDFAIGRDVEGGTPLVGQVDELRISRGIAYRDRFDPPSSFSANRRQRMSAAATPLRGEPAPDELEIGAHVFLDSSLFENASDLVAKLNPPSIDVLDFRADQQWEVSPRFGPAIPDILDVYDADGELRMAYTNGGFWTGGWRSAVSVARSTDGRHWEKPDLGIVFRDGSTHNNIVLPYAIQGTMFYDPNPVATDDERHKFIGQWLQRGIYGFVSPDGFHWRRNETVALPFDCGGGVEAFWDNQTGTYVAYVRSEGFVFERGMEKDLLEWRSDHRLDRAVTRAESPSFHGPWPFTPSLNPRTRDTVFCLPTVTTELPVVIDTSPLGAVYRGQAIKYPWAPNAYLAFPWRYRASSNIRPGSELGVSRDGVSWTYFGEPYYFGPGWSIDGRDVVESLVVHGLVRRGNEIWHYGTAKFTAHAGGAFKGDERYGGAHDRLVRLVQRVDGFVALEPRAQAATVLTRPIRLSGDEMRLNAIADGSISMQIENVDGGAIQGFGFDAFIPITGDSTEHAVEWTAAATLAGLRAAPVRLRIRLDRARLFSIRLT